MKKSFWITLMLIALIFAAVVYAISATTQDKQKDKAANTTLSNIESTEKRLSLNYENVKAIWLSQFDMREIYTDGDGQRAQEDYTERVRKVIKNIRSIGINTVYIQLRPNGDSIYPSELFPASKYVSGAYGKEIEYDAFGIFLDLAHTEGLSVHAWINPLRCMTAEELLLIPDRYTIKKWYNEAPQSKVVKVDDRYYLNPAYREVRALICDGVSEIIKNYPVDGIHIDDYFYPTTEEYFDAREYSAYTERGGILSLPEFRREQINALVRDIYATVKQRDHSILFGVSPGGNTDRNYNELYADVVLWCASDCYIDYICPQIYYGLEHETHPFDEICDEFAEMVSARGIKLIIGMTLEKAYEGYIGVSDEWAGSGAEEWIHSRDILKRCLEYVSITEECQGVAFFSYRLFFSPEDGTRISETKEEIAAFLPIFKNS